MQPTFMMVGGQRCGTDTLFHTLALHPNVRRPPVVKGTDYYTLYADRSQAWYRGHFPVRLPGRSLDQTFEACTYYMFHPTAIERLAADFPDLRLVVMLRDPVERAYSAYKHELARGYETEPDFLKALELEESRLRGQVEYLAADPTNHSFSHRHHAYRLRGEFDTQIERILAHYPRERVHVMDSETFFQEPVSEYRRVVEFLGLPAWEPAHIGQRNARPSSDMPASARDLLTEHFVDHDAHLAEILGRQPGWSRR